MPIPEDQTFKRLHKHAQKRLVFDPGVPRGQQLPAYKRYIELEEAILEEQHKKGASGLKVCQSRAAMVDVVIENIFLAALDLYTSKYGSIPCKMSLLATGGYGRRELNPLSDIDILFLYPERIKGEAFDRYQEVLSEEILYPLWDFGWKVGHASRNTKEVIQEAKKEIQSKNAVLESRLICGSTTLYKRMQTRFLNYCKEENSNPYIQQRLIDERQRHEKFGSSVFLQEPDIKNGVGGLRDYQNILWMANIKFGYRSFKEINQAKLLRRHLYLDMEAAYNFLLRTRTELHLQNRRPNDKLYLEQQPSIALGLGYAQADIFERVEAFMKDYYSAARTIHQISEILKERLALSSETDPRSSASNLSFRKLSPLQKSQLKRIDGFILKDRMLFHEKQTVFTEEPLRLIRIFHLMQQYGASLHPDLKFRISRSLPLIDAAIINHPSAAKSFCSILKSPGDVYPTLEQMHELGVLRRYLPEFDPLTCKVQHEYYHRYTADEHILRTIRHLDKILQKDSSVNSIYEVELRKNEDPLLLYLMLLLHDIGKSEGVKGHAVNGVRIAQPILDRFGIGDKQQSQILFIIRHHLEMSRIWQRFDLDDPETAHSFAKTVGNKENLRFLYVHTVCDTCGTAPTLWNDYKEVMHQTLFKRTLLALENEGSTRQEPDKKRQLLEQKIEHNLPKDITKEEIHAHFSSLPERYFTTIANSEIQLHLEMVHQFLVFNHQATSAEVLNPIIHWHNDVELNQTIVTIVSWDRAGLFYKLAGALTLAGVTIVSTKAFSRSDNISIDTFCITDLEGGIVTNKEALNTFRTRCKESLVNGKPLANDIKHLESFVKEAQTPLPERFSTSLSTEVDIYHEPNLNQTIIEVTSDDHTGLLYQVARQIYTHGFDITFARISTERGTAMDTFYIKKIDPRETVRQTDYTPLREKILQATEALGASQENEK